MSESAYILSSPAEKERLQFQAQLWESRAEAFLDQLGVQPGWHCLDVGCGAMGILGPLSRRVGPAGRVVGIDSDPTLIAAARAYALEQGLSNVEVLEADARDTGLARESFDLTHIRFVLVFGHWQKILAEMIALTRVDGLVAVQETDQSAWNFYPANPTWPRLKGVLEEAFLCMGGDANLGQRLLPLLRAHGLQEVRLSSSSLTLAKPGPYMQMPLIGARGFRPVILQNGLLSELELDELLADYEMLIADQATYATWFNLMQAWGRKG